MKLKMFSTAVAALSLVAAPTMASAAQPVVATPLTQPAAETVDGDSALFGGGAGFLVAALAIVLIGLGIYAATDGNDTPNSA